MQDAKKLPSEFDQKLQKARCIGRDYLRTQVGREVGGYTREKLLLGYSALISGPKSWLEDQSYETSLIVRRRLRSALYRQRAARATHHYTFSQIRYVRLLGALIAERRMSRALIEKLRAQSEAA